jgi:hypothetical protein
MPATITFNIAEQADDTSAGTITSWGQGTATATSVTFSPSVSQAGTLWWAMTARKQGADNGTSSSCPSIDDIKANAAEPNVPEGEYTQA